MGEEPMRVLTAIPHRQFHGDLCCFFQLSRPPPTSLLSIIKRTGGAYRKGPHGMGAGWHHKDPGGLAALVKGKWPAFAKILNEIRNTLRRDPDGADQPGRVGGGGVDVTSGRAFGELNSKPATVSLSIDSMSMRQGANSKPRKGAPIRVIKG